MPFLICGLPMCLQIEHIARKPRRLLSYLYSVISVIVSSVYKDAITFAGAIIMVASRGQAVDARLQKFIAIVLVASVCLFRSVSRMNYVRLSILFALYKVVLMVSIMTIGCAMVVNDAPPFSQSGSRAHFLSNIEPDISDNVITFSRASLALISISKAYTGYHSINNVGPSFQLSCSTC